MIRFALCQFSICSRRVHVPHTNVLSLRRSPVCTKQISLLSHRLILSLSSCVSSLISPVWSPKLFVSRKINIKLIYKHTHAEVISRSVLLGQQLYWPMCFFSWNLLPAGGPSIPVAGRNKWPRGGINLPGMEKIAMAGKIPPFWLLSKFGLATPPPRLLLLTTCLSAFSFPSWMRLRLFRHRVLERDVLFRSCFQATVFSSCIFVLSFLCFYLRSLFIFCPPCRPRRASQDVPHSIENENIQCSR